MMLKVTFYDSLRSGNGWSSIAGPQRNSLVMQDMYCLLQAPLWLYLSHRPPASRLGTHCRFNTYGGYKDPSYSPCYIGYMRIPRFRGNRKIYALVCNRTTCLKTRNNEPLKGESRSFSTISHAPNTCCHGLYLRKGLCNRQARR